MSLKAKRKVVSSIPPMDGGTYMGVCVAVVDLGQQYKQFEKQKQGKYAEECMFIFEIPDERVEVDGEDKPRWLSSRRFTVSLHERAALFQMLTAWRGKALTDAELDPAGDGFDLMQMAGVPAMLSVTVVEKDDGSKYNRIEAVTGFPKGIPAPKPESEILVFDADEPDMEVFGSSASLRSSRTTHPRKRSIFRPKNRKRRLTAKERARFDVYITGEQLSRQRLRRVGRGNDPAAGMRSVVQGAAKAARLWRGGHYRLPCQP